MPHVLLVDDGKDILALLTEFLERHGCTVGGLEALVVPPAAGLP